MERNKIPQWASHILKWKGDEETLYVGKDRYQMATDWNGNPWKDAEVTVMDDLEQGKTMVQWFLEHHWKILYTIPKQLENK